VWAVAVLAIAAAAVLILAVRPAVWPKWTKAARDVELMRRDLQHRSAPPRRRPATAGGTPVVLSDIEVARGLSPDGRPRDVTQTVSPDDRVVYVVFEYTGAPEGASLTSDWYLNGRYQALKTVPIRLPAGEGRGHVELRLDDASGFPAGAYRVDLILDDTVVGTTKFTVARRPGPP
jgi:hypothetical protein